MLSKVQKVNRLKDINRGSVNALNQQILDDKLYRITKMLAGVVSSRICYGSIREIFTRFGVFSKYETNAVLDFLEREGILSRNKCYVFVNHTNIRKKLGDKK